jgi:hypothetical protein
VRLVSEKLNQGQDWRQLEASHGQDDEEDAVTSARPGFRRLQLAKPNAASSRSKAKAKQSKGFGGSKASAASSGGSGDQLAGKKQKSCSWQAYVNEKMWNVAYPDTQAVYQVLVQQHLDKTRILRITGKFPTKGVKYFSFQSNNKDVRIRA